MSTEAETRSASDATTDAAQERLRLALAVDDVAVWELDPRDDRLALVVGLARLYGLGSDAALTRRQDLLAPVVAEDLARLEATIAAVVPLPGGARVVRLELRVRRPDGAVRWIRAAGEVRFDAAGAPESVRGTARDVTDERRAAEEQRRSLDIVEESPDIIMTASAGGEPLYLDAAGRTEHPHLALEGVVLQDRGVWLPASATPIFRAGDATPHAGVATFTDITALRELVDRARESEGRLTAMIQFAMDAVISLDETHRITVFNAAAERIFGVPASEALGGTIDRFIPERHRERHRGHVDRFSASMSTTRSMASPPTLFGVRANGDEFPLEATISRVRVSGRVTMTVILRDVTEHRAIEAERRRSEARLRAIVDSANDAIVCFDGAGAVSVWNAEAERIFGWREAEALGRDVGELITSPETRGEFAAFLARLRDRRDGSPRLRNFETEGVDRTGRRIPLDITLSLAAIDGEALQSAIIRDDTHRREAQRVLFERSEELARVNVELEQALRVKDEFLATVSHELRTPLQAVIGLSMALNAGHYGEISHTQKGIVRAVATSGELLLQLINDLLDLTKVEAEQLSLTPSETDIAQAVEECVEHVRDLAERKGLRLVHAVAPGIPLLSLDTLRFKQVLLNILGNAIKFTVAGAIDVRVLVEGSSLVLRVRDTGIGIAAADLERIFRPFTQIDTGLRRQHAGTGLGLTLTRRLVELFQGTIEVESAPGAGSTFTVRLPIVLIKPVAPCAAAEREGDRKVRPLRILLCEDNEVNVLTLSAFLEALGHEVLVASDGQEAIERAVASQPDLVLMDVQMPVLDGIEAVRRLRADASTRRLRIVTLTAMGRSKDREQAAAVGADAFLTKPVTAEQLDRMIASLFSAEP